MNRTDPDPTIGTKISRRSFLGAAAGSTAAAFLPPTDATAQEPSEPSVLTDYVGRLCYNENPLGPSPAARDAMIDSAPMGHRYPDWYADSLRLDLASMHGLSTSQLVAGCGATEILRLCALAYAEPGVNVVCPYPSYGQFPGDASFLGAEVRYADLDAEHRIDLGAMLSLVDGSTTAVCLTNPNNPTATVLSAAEIEAFAETLPDDVTLLIDEAYHEYVHDPSYGSAMELVRQGANVIVIRTFSKVFGLAGVRIGYAAGRSNLISPLSAWHIYATVSRPSLAAARAALVDTDHITQTVALNDSVKQYCFSSLDAMQLDTIPSETNFFMVDVGQSAGGVAGELAARGIQVRTGWGMPHHLRVSTGTMAEMESFIAALQDILGLSGSVDRNDPRTTRLDGNFPNPFRRSTEVRFSLARRSRLQLAVYDVRGRRVRSLVDREHDRGLFTEIWDGRNDAGNEVAAGTYLLHLRADGHVETRRAIRIP